MPQLGELRLHNGTVYRWNRPVYDVVDGRPHLRVENRVLPAGPTVVDMLANARLLLRPGPARSPRQDRPIWTQMSFSAAEENFHAAARHGIDAARVLAGARRVPVDRAGAAPAAAAGRTRASTGWGVDPAQRDRLLGIIEQRCLTGRNGATWQVETVHRIEGSGQIDRDDTMRKLLEEYLPRMHSNVPVHEW